MTSSGHICHLFKFFFSFLFNKYFIRKTCLDYSPALEPNNTDFWILKSTRHPVCISASGLFQEAATLNQSRRKHMGYSFIHPCSYLNNIITSFFLWAIYQMVAELVKIQPSRCLHGETGHSGNEYWLICAKGNYIFSQATGYTQIMP